MPVKLALPSHIYDQLADDSLIRKTFERLDDCQHEPTKRPSIVFGKRFEMCRKCGKILS